MPIKPYIVTCHKIMHALSVCHVVSKHGQAVAVTPDSINSMFVELETNIAAVPYP